MNRREQNKTEGILPLRASTRPIHEKKTNPSSRKRQFQELMVEGGGG